MTRRKFKTYMVTFIIVSISVLAGFMINNFQRKDVLNPNQNEVESEEALDSNFSAAAKEDLKFYVNENNVEKTMQRKNETTILEISCKLFITNSGTKAATIDPDAFAIFYNTNGGGRLYETKYENVEKPLIVDIDESVSINFKVRYVVDDGFKNLDNNELRFNYMSKQILVCFV